MFVFFNDPATTEIYTLSLHDALPISEARSSKDSRIHRSAWKGYSRKFTYMMVNNPPEMAQSQLPARTARYRSEEHTSELQSRQYLVCRLLLEKKTNSVHANSDLPSDY